MAGETATTGHQDSTTGMVNMPDDFEPRPIGIYGKWAYRIVGEFKMGKDHKFPPFEQEGVAVHLVHTMPSDGKADSLDDCNPRWLDWVKSKGANYIMFGHGQTCTVIRLQ